MSSPGTRAPGDDLAPVFQLLIDGDKPLDTDITDFIQSVEFESALDMADLLQITVANPSNVAPGAAGAPPDWTLHKALQPGQEIELRGGYGRTIAFIGRAILVKHLPDFPQDGMPTLKVKGYDPIHLMMDAAGPLSLRDARIAPVNPRPFNALDDAGVPFKNITPANAVRRLAAKYGFTVDADDTDNSGTPLRPTNFLQRKGVSDFEICRMLANLNRKEMWLDWDELTAKWVFHWRKSRDQTTPKYTFEYANGDYSSLLSYSCQYGLKDNLTSVVVMFWDAAKQRWLSGGEVENASGQDPRMKQGGGVAERGRTAKAQVGDDGMTVKTKHMAKKNAKIARRAVTGNPDEMRAFSTATEFRIAAAGVAIDIKVDVPFASLDDATRFATNWLKQSQDNFIIATGTIIGVETLRAGQVHSFEGLGNRLSGDYYFINVRHKFTPDKGYICEFTARMILGDNGPTTNNSPEL